jgi:hypothetical protein
MRRRTLLKSAMTFGALAVPLECYPLPSKTGARRRPRPGESGWPSEEEWSQLKQVLQGRLVRPTSPLQECIQSVARQECDAIFQALRNPYAIRDDPALTQTLGWVDAWLSEPSSYAVAVESAADIAAAVRFARLHHLRLVFDRALSNKKSPFRSTRFA